MCEYVILYVGASLEAQTVNNLPAVWETWVESLGWSDPLEKEKLPTPVFWPGEVHGLYSPWDHKELDTTERLSLHFHITQLIGGGIMYYLCNSIGGRLS